MTRLILLNLLFSVYAGGGYIQYVYKVVSEQKTWSEAQSHCKLKYTNLVTIKNMDELNSISVMLNKEPADATWIGLKRQDTWKWRWSLGNEDLYQDGQNYTRWSSAQPDNWLGMEYCTQIFRNGLWNDNYCNSFLPFVCYAEKNTNTSKYILVNEQKTWYEAQTYCREKYTDLASARNQSENDQIKAVIQSVYTAWIGLYNDSWKWSDQTASVFTYWNMSNVDGDVNCAVVSKSHYWNAFNCTTKLPFICYENKLILINMSVSWWDALNYCRKNHHDLVSVCTEEIQLWVKALSRKASTSYVWLGLRYDCAQRIWFWVCGSMLCYLDWAPGNGTWDGDCRRSGAIESGGDQQWMELPETYKLNFICSTKDDLFY